MTAGLHHGRVRDVAAADLYGDIQPAAKARLRDLFPGLAVTLAATLAAGFLSDHYGAPLTLMALLIGLALNFLNTDARLAPWLTVASRSLLRWGIVLVGVRVTLMQIVQLGPLALLAVIGVVAATIGTGILIARRLGFTPAFGVLAGGAVAICGASAAMALASLLGERRVGQAQLTVTLVGISAMSSLAMFLYPILARDIGMGDHQAGFLLGAAIHDVAQSLGAGYSFSQVAGQTAAIVKLSRVALLAPVMAVVALFFPTEGARSLGAAALPWFVIGFFALAAVNSTGIVPLALADAVQRLATGLLACAVTATGIRSPMQALLHHGPRPLLVIVGATLVSLALSLAGAFLVVR
jgi:uncharacterized integral membrane protein (TIGR00698 family)